MPRPGPCGPRLLGLGLVVCLTAPEAPHRSRRRESHAIKTGMNRNQVEALFGVPAGDYTTGTLPLPVADGRHSSFCLFLEPSGRSR
jgi:hypothetical protein